MDYLLSVRKILSWLNDGAVSVRLVPTPFTEKRIFNYDSQHPKRIGAAEKKKKVPILDIYFHMFKKNKYSIFANSRGKYFIFNSCLTGNPLLLLY